MKRMKELVVAGVTLIRNKPTLCYGLSAHMCMYVSMSSRSLIPFAARRSLTNARV